MAAFDAAQYSPDMPFSKYPTRGGTLVVPELGTATHESSIELLEDVIQQYHAATVGNQALSDTNSEFIRRVGTGAEGRVYHVPAAGNVVAKVFGRYSISSLRGPTDAMRHMEQLRWMLEASGNTGIRVPKHHGLYIPHNGMNYISVQDRAAGENLYELFQDPTMPEEYQMQLTNIFNAFQLVEPTVSRIVEPYGRTSRDFLEDLKPANILVELGDPNVSTIAGHPYTFWLLDQASPES